MLEDHLSDDDRQGFLFERSVYGTAVIRRTKDGKSVLSVWLPLAEFWEIEKDLTKKNQ